MHKLETQRFDLSLGQKELWYIHTLKGSAQSAYNEHLAYSLQGLVSVDQLKKAFELLLEKHPLLRTSFDKDLQGNLYQRVHTECELELVTLENRDNQALDALIGQFIKRPFDLCSPPLMRVLYCNRSAHESILVIVVHHIIIDGTSFAILIEDLAQFYNQSMRDETICYPSNPLSYFDHVHQQQEKIATAAYLEKVKEEALSLKGYSGLNFLTTPMQNKREIFSGQRVYFQLDKVLYAKMAVFSKTEKVTLFHLFYSIYCLLLYQYTRSQDIAIGIPFANREADPNHTIIGYFANTLPIKMHLKLEETFSAFLARVKTRVFSALFNQNLAFEHLASELKCERKNVGQHPLIQNLFIWGSTDKLKLGFEGVHAELLHLYGSETAKFDLTLVMLEENKEQITAYFEYRDSLFDRAFIERITSSFKSLLEQVLLNPQTFIGQISLLDQQEMQRMKEKFFNAYLDRKVTMLLSDRFSETAMQYKENIGLIFGDEKYEYQTIETKSNQWANYIRYHYKEIYQKELAPNTLIALCVDRREDMIFGMLGILKAGAAYVPLDPQYPSERINYIIQHSKASLLLTHKVHDALKLDFESKHIIYMDEKNIETSPYFVDRICKNKTKPNDLAYVLYTSGSTGQPKGVGVSHENVICLFESLKEQFSLSHNDIWSLFHTFCFDISVWEIWGAFLFGGALVIIPYELSRDPKRFYQLIETEAVTVLTQTASAFQIFINEDLLSPKKLSKLRYVAFVGESLKVSILRPWVEKYGCNQPRLANMYGITETTVYTNYKFIDQIDIDKGRDNIGWPLKEFSICVMDDNLHWCPVGIVGEICIGGRGLSHGYLYRDDLTQEKFIADPYTKFLGLKEGSRLYRTGDLGRWLDDGSIEYLGRKDFQIKLRGFRIELGEIESALGSYAGITHSAVLLKGVAETAYLAAYYTVQPGQQVNPESLSSYLKSYLPDYMVPKSFMLVPSFPMTVNGKIDRLCLSTYKDNFISEKEIIRPGTPLEWQLAKIWADVLNIDIEEIGLNTNFFALGGNSLLVIKLLTLVSNQMKIDFSLSQFVAQPSLSTLVSIVQNANCLNTSTTEALWQRLKQDIILDAAIQPLKKPNLHQFKPETILLTGATGFLGAHMLFELLENTAAIVYCLVKAENYSLALDKINKILEKYKLDVTKHQGRMLPVLGDLALPKLGLLERDFETITEEADALFHVGAKVHHVLDYATLFNANVQSVNELLKMAICKKNKSIHFISTLGTQYISPLEALPFINSSHLNSNGYLCTKWVSEQLLQEAQNRGIAAQVYRPGNIIAGKNGIYEPYNNHNLLRLKGMLQLGKGFVSSEEQIEMVPVDLLSATIRKLSEAAQLFAYNLHNSETISWSQYLMLAKNMGYPFQLIHDAYEWNQLLDTLEENNALYKLSYLYKIQKDSAGTNAYASDPLLKESKGLGIKPNYQMKLPPYEEMIFAQLKSLIAIGFLDAPTKSDLEVSAF